HLSRRAIHIFEKSEIQRRRLLSPYFASRHGPALVLLHQAEAVFIKFPEKEAKTTDQIRYFYMPLLSPAIVRTATKIFYTIFTLLAFAKQRSVVHSRKTSHAVVRSSHFLTSHFASSGYSISMLSKTLTSMTSSKSLNHRLPFPAMATSQPAATFVFGGGHFLPPVRKSLVFC
uniref:Uncharacterized protein n=1 Tax=Romanomermis culicivorax TaxID=13658 RepID=A0A915L9C6_ROMCU